jgi:hypothetical protein
VTGSDGDDTTEKATDMTAPNIYPDREYVDLPDDMHYSTEYGTATQFNRTWSGHRFTDQEADALAAGQSITFTLAEPDGTVDTVVGHLEGKVFDPGPDSDRGPIPYVGFVKEVNSATHAEGIWARTGAKIRFKRSFGTHTFSEGEVTALLADEYVGFTATSAKGGEYEATGKLERLWFDTAAGRRVHYVGFSPDFGH